MPDGVWIDGTDMLEDGKWLWVDTMTPIQVDNTSYTSWYPGEPNSIHRFGEDCMDLLHHEQYMWNDDKCEYKMNFLCEKV